MRDLPCVGLGFADQRCQATAQLLSGRPVEAVVDLASIDQVVPFSPTKIDTVPVVAVERKARDRQGLALGASLLHPIIAAAGIVFAVSHLGNNALKPDLAGVAVHFGPIDLETLAELDIRPHD